MTASETPTLTATRGLPGSGKTHWATEQVAAARPGTLARVSRDDIGRMLHGRRYKLDVTEQQVSAVEAATIEDMLRHGTSVIADSMNLSAKYVRRLAEIAWRAGADFSVRDFTDVPVETCIKRDALRPAPDRVGEPAILDKYVRYLKGKRGPLPIPAKPAAPTGRRYVPDLSLPKAILIDIDGTVALRGDRDPYDTSRYHEDAPNRPVIAAVRAMIDHGHHPVYCSGRDEQFRAVTEDWIARYVGRLPVDLHMRPRGDVRRDDIVKLELFDRHIRDRWNVVAAWDDRDRVVRAYRDVLGLSVWQVADGRF